MRSRGVMRLGCRSLTVTPALAREAERMNRARVRTLGACYCQKQTIGYLGAASGDYAARLAAVGLHPDNPDGMFANLQSFLLAPLDFKNADKCWPGTRDKLTWYQQGNVAILEWPFHGGLWLDQGCPKNPDQARAVFKIPAQIGVKEGLSRIYGFPFRSDLQYQFQCQSSSCGGGGFDLFQALGGAVNALVGVANSLNIPLVNVTAALLTGKDPIQGLKDDLSHFMAAGAIAKGVVSGDMHPLAQQASAAAASFGVHLDSNQLAAVATAANNGDASGAAAAAMGPAYTSAWQAATNFGMNYDPSLPPPAGKSYAPAVVPPAPPKPAAAPAPAPKPKRVIALHLGPAHPAATTHPAAAPAKPMGTAGKVAAYGAAGGGAYALAWLAMNGWKWVTPRWLARLGK